MQTASKGCHRPSCPPGWPSVRRNGPLSRAISKARFASGPYGFFPLHSIGRSDRPKPGRSWAITVPFWLSSPITACLENRLAPNHAAGYSPVAPAHDFLVHIDTIDHNKMAVWISELLFRHRPGHELHRDKELSSQHDQQQNEHAEAKSTQEEIFSYLKQESF